MKIVHICLNGPVTDGWSYQDNLLPKYHRKLGYDVVLVASKYVRNKGIDLEIDERNTYLNSDEVKMIRLENKFKTTIRSKFKLYKGLYGVLKNEKPDIIFVHGVQFLNIFDIIKYLKHNPDVIAYADNHSDFSNSASNFFSEKILHGVIWKYCAQKLNPHIKKFYGVLPSRVDFLKNIYKLPENKIELLLMGADDELVKKSKNINVKREIRENYQMNQKDFLIVTGGKIDQSKKQILHLMEAIKSINNEQIKLLVFGPVADSLREEFETLLKHKNIHYISWVNGEESHNYFATADLVVFPGRHSVYWEQTAGLGIPMIVKYWEGTDHVDVGGNVKFLYENSIQELKKLIEEIVNDKNIYREMKKAAEEEGTRKFSYYEIAKKSLET